MFRGIFSFFARLLLFAATGLFTAAFVALGASCFLLTWPFIHGTSKRRKMRLYIDLVAALGNVLSNLSFEKVVRQAIERVEESPDSSVSESE